MIERPIEKEPVILLVVKSMVVKEELSSLMMYAVLLVGLMVILQG